ncbi:MAG: putative ABC transport system permease protein [Planctomycetota bacterium]|jgi:putative ABC transport system permease protein
MILLKIIAESFIMAAKELFSSKMRSFLSLFGISIGILCLISVFSAVDSLEKNIKKSITNLGGDIIYVGKWPWLMTEEYPWWKYIQRPSVSKEDFYSLEGTVKTAESMALWMSVNQYTLKNANEYIENVNTFAVTKDYNVVREFELEQGRYFTDLEFKKESPKVILGNIVAQALFPNIRNAVGTKITIGGIPIEVIGVLKKEGADILGINKGFGLDNTVYVTEVYASTYLDVTKGGDPSIMVKAKENIPLDEVEAELIGKMRIVRRLSPKQDDNFALNKINVFTKAFEPVFSTMFLIGLLIGGFSIIVGVFGIANIMFVSVKERTAVIGVKKALGAKRIYILLEFFIEAVLLSIFGGLIGLLAVMGLFGLMNLAMADSGFVLVISQKNMIIGLGVSIVSGIVAGFVPAYMASKMKPVDAMRSA